MTKNSIIDQLESGERARLIPVTSSRQKELAAVSTVLSVFRIVPEYARIMLEEAGAPWSKRSRLSAWSEVCFKKKKQTRSSLPRPDGMLVVDTTRSEWVALVEGKIKGEEIKAEQLERYMDLAREVGADAILTISNQFATVPNHHPTLFDKKKKGKVGLYHFSWLSLLSNAQLLSENDSVTDREQAIVLKELIRFLEHDLTGVKPFDRMGPSWKDICSKVQNAETLRKADPALDASIADWHQLCRYLALSLSTHIGKQVAIHMTRKHKKDPEARVRDHLETVISRYRLADDFNIPNAAGLIHLEADLRRRTISMAMQLDPPADKKRPTAAVNWLTRQLKGKDVSNLLVCCSWPKRTPTTALSFAESLEYPEDLVPEGVNELPTKLEVRRVVDLAGRFKGAKTLVEDTEKAFRDFYKDIGQHLTPWTPPPPKYRKRDSDSGNVDGDLNARASVDEDQETRYE